METENPLVLNLCVTKYCHILALLQYLVQLERLTRMQCQWVKNSVHHFLPCVVCTRSRSSWRKWAFSLSNLWVRALHSVMRSSLLRMCFAMPGHCFSRTFALLIRKERTACSYVRRYSSDSDRLLSKLATKICFSIKGTVVSGRREVFATWKPVTSTCSLARMRSSVLKAQSNRLEQNEKKQKLEGSVSACFWTMQVLKKQPKRKNCEKIMNNFWVNLTLPVHPQQFDYGNNFSKLLRWNEQFRQHVIGSEFTDQDFSCLQTLVEIVLKNPKEKPRNWSRTHRSMWTGTSRPWDEIGRNLISLNFSGSFNPFSLEPTAPSCKIASKNVM